MAQRARAVGLTVTVREEGQVLELVLPSTSRPSPDVFVAPPRSRPDSGAWPRSGRRAASRGGCGAVRTVRGRRDGSTVPPCGPLSHTDA